MPAKKKQPDRRPDRHASGFLIRLPEHYRAAFAALKAKHRRTYTVEVQIAMDAHLAANGIPAPESHLKAGK